jgi:hypothetical protein
MAPASPVDPDDALLHWGPGSRRRIRRVEMVSSLARARRKSRPATGGTSCSSSWRRTHAARCPRPDHVIERTPFRLARLWRARRNRETGSHANFCGFCVSAPVLCGTRSACGRSSAGRLARSCRRPDSRGSAPLRRSRARISDARDRTCYAGCVERRGLEQRLCVMTGFAASFGGSGLVVLGTLTLLCACGGITREDGMTGTNGTGGVVGVDGFGGTAGSTSASGPTSTGGPTSAGGSTAVHGSGGSSGAANSSAAGGAGGSSGAESDGARLHLGCESYSPPSCYVAHGCEEVAVVMVDLASQCSRYVTAMCMRAGCGFLSSTAASGPNGECGVFPRSCAPQFWIAQPTSGAPSACNTSAAVPCAAEPPSPSR